MSFLPVFPQSRLGILLVVSGPSGSGKTTLCRRLAEENHAQYAISCTTRAPRPGEMDGHDYFFLSKEGFQTAITEGKFLEWAEVHGNFYGTLKSEVIGRLQNGVDVVMDIDVQGAEAIRSCTDDLIRKSYVDLFVLIRAGDELKARLSGRATDSQEVIDLRMENALEEMQYWGKYQYCFVSGSREEDFAKTLSVIQAERLRILRLI